MKLYIANCCQCLLFSKQADSKNSYANFFWKLKLEFLKLLIGICASKHRENWLFFRVCLWHFPLTKWAAGTEALKKPIWKQRWQSSEEQCKVLPRLTITINSLLSSLHILCALNRKAEAPTILLLQLCATT